MRTRGFRIGILTRSVISAGELGLLLAIPGVARAEIYITNNGSNLIGEYTTSGDTVNRDSRSETSRACAHNCG